MNTIKKRGLGRGLSALLDSAETDISSGTLSDSTSRLLGSVALIPVAQIETNPFQPRTQFDEQALEDLASSIKAYGIIQPVTVRKVSTDKFQLISGERRFRASQRAGLAEIPAYIRVANDQAMLEMALVENIQRQDLDAIEVALSYQRLIEECNLTHEALSDRVGKNRATITNYLRLLKLEPEIQAGIRLGKLSMGHARAICGIELPEDRRKVFDLVLAEGLSVRQTELLAQGTRTPEARRKATASKEVTPLSLDLQKFKSDLTDFLGTRVVLRRHRNGAGKIEIEFGSEAELDKIRQKFEL